MYPRCVMRTRCWTGRAARCALLIGALLFAWPAGSAGDGVPTRSRALPPGAAAIVQRSLAREAPVVRLGSARLEPDHADLVVCPEAGPCFEVRLEDPRLGCHGEVAGPFCLRFPSEQPRPDARAAVIRGFAAEDPRGAWIEIADPASDGHSMPGGSPGRSGPSPFALLLALTMVPLTAGALFGSIARVLLRRRVASRALAVALFVVPPLLAVAVGVRQRVVGVWDLAVAGAQFGLGVWLIAHRGALALRTRRAALVAGSTLIALLAAEGVVRIALPRPPPIDPAERHRLFLDAHHADMAFARFDFWRDNDLATTVRRALYPTADSGFYVERGARAPGATRHVLHLGDSMVFGLGVDRGQAFPGVLESLEPGVAHINSGIPSLAPDAELLLLRRWVARTPLDQVVVHLFTGNDIKEMDAAYPFCADGPLLDYAPPSPRARCPEPDYRFARGHLRWMLEHSPPPYVLREIGGFSVLAERTVLALTALRERVMGHSRGDEVAWQHLERVLRAMRDELAARHIDLVVDVLPLRAALEAFDPTITEAYATRTRMVAMTRALGITVLDPWDVFQDAVRRDGAARWFARAMTHDLHFSPEGHALLARWLAERLRPGR